MKQEGLLQWRLPAIPMRSGAVDPNNPATRGHTFRALSVRTGNETQALSWSAELLTEQR